MDLINNQYLLLKKIDDLTIAPRYLVRDITNNEEIELSIVSKDFVGASLLDFYTDKYPVYKSLISPVIVKSLDFGIIKKINDKKNRNLQYYILSEHFETAGTLGEILPALTSSNALNLFVQACRAVYYLHTKDIFYKELNFETIMIGKTDEEYTLKLKDMALAELYKRNHWPSESYNLYFKSPETIYEGNISKQADIYSLGVFLFCLVSKNECGYKDFKTDFYRYKTEATDEFSRKAMTIIERMTVKNEYISIIDVIGDINNSFWTNHKAFEVSEVQHLVFDSRLVGRDRELQLIMDNFDRVSFGRETKRYVSVHGEFGIGRSMFLKTLSSKLYSKNLNVYSSFRHEHTGALNDIVNQLMSDYPEIDSYPDEYNNSVIKYIYDCIKDKPVIIIIDDFEKSDEYTIAAFEKLIEINKKSMLVFSYRNGYLTDHLSSLISAKANDGTLFDMELSLLSNDDSALLIKQVVGYSELSTDLARSMHPFVNGNPLFIEETLKHLYFNKVLFVDEDDGMWHANTDSYEDVPMPKSIHHAVAEQAAKLEKASYEALEAVSVFNIEVSAKDVCPLLGIDENTLNTTLDHLAHEGILLEITIKVPKYIFSNRILKNYIYEKLDGKLEMHRHAADSLIKADNLSDKILNEIIYQLEKSGQDELLLEYSLKSVDTARKSLNIERVIDNLNKALDISRRFNLKDHEFNVILNISYLYRNSGRYSKAIEYMIQAEKLTDTSERNRITVINELSSSYLMVNELFEAKAYLEKVKHIFSDFEMREKYHDIYIMHLYKEALILYYESEYHRLYIAAKHGLRICPEENFAYKARFHTMIGHSCMYTGRHEESLDNYLKAGMYYEKAEDINSYVVTVLNIAMLYRNWLGDSDMAKIMLKEVIDLSSKRRIFEPQAYALNNMGNIYFADMNITEAALNYAESLRIAELIGEPMVSFSCKCNLSVLYINSDEYEKAYTYLTECENIVKAHPQDRNKMMSYWQLGAEFYLTMGCPDKAEEYLSEIKSNTCDMLVIAEKDLCILKEYVKACRSLNDKDKLLRRFEAVKVYGIDLGSKIKELNTVCDFLLFMHDCGRLSDGTFYEDLINLPNLAAGIITRKNELPYLKAKVLFLKSIMRQGGERTELLTEAYGLAKKCGQRLFLAKICIELSDCLSNNYTAISYAAEACEIIQTLLSGIRDEFKESYISRHGLLRPFFRILSGRDVSGLAPLELVFHEHLFTDIINDNDFNAAEKENYYSKLPDNIKCAADVIKNLGTSPEKNLNLIASYLVAVTYASWCAIITEQTKDEFIVVESNDGNTELDRNGYIFKKTRTIGEYILITEKYKNYSIEKEEMPSESIKALMSIPIKLSSDSEILGYLYLHSTSVFNNFRQETLEECLWFMNLIKINLELYLMRMTSSVDKLTGALNRKFLETSIDQCIEKALETNSVFSLIMIDFDSFKGINDNYGHQTGDEVLRDAGRIIRSNLRKDTVFGRYGGEEFVVLLDGAGWKSALTVAEKLKNSIDSAKLMGSKRPVTASIGISTFGEHDKTKTGLLEKADKALYMCKSMGGNRCVVWNKEIDTSARCTNNFNGISTGDAELDQLRMRIVLNMIELIRSDIPADDKIKSFLSKIAEITSADSVKLLAANDPSIGLSAYEFKVINTDYLLGVVSIRMPDQQAIAPEDADFINCLCNIIAASFEVSSAI